MPRSLTLSLLAAALVLTGCANLAPTYEQPAAPVPAAYPDGADGGTLTHLMPMS